MTGSRNTVSAPGKVLLAGGYLVLDREYTGLVFGLDARIHIHIQSLPTSSGVELSEIIVKSPQFKEAHWEYGYRLVENGGGIEVTQLSTSAYDKLHRNPFVETALAFALTYVSTRGTKIIKPATITILSDNDYYSTPESSTEDQVSKSTTRFLNFNVPLWEAHKTGLGSSAALVTSFTAAVLVHYLGEEVFNLSSDKEKRILHNLAQAAHCSAQGKVGSGFDVASAVYGSCLYRRFSPELLQAHGDPGSLEFGNKLQKLVEETELSTQWDTEIIKSAISVPPGIRLVMCDVDCGSQTPGMAKKVLAWRKERPQVAEQLWGNLQEANEALAAELVKLAKSRLMNHTNLKSRILDIRQLIRQMSKFSDVPIEPPAQTQLLDNLSRVDGVIGGVVPGAGGYDAVTLLIEDRPEVLEKIRVALKGWKPDIQEGSEPSIGRVRMLGVREEMEGVRLEDPANYDNWI
ncbi:ERG8, Phosphomevalonate kinase [Patellaria atrata CBS 101060]|uniref:Phosphomevalonate kinase n=1 Tax=Patellaria atrata CBS 101060 TaxID=1346257 RepID=A0A9P4SH86_9PEZI|nr:ERG8, Phosphomevalonate kinase [Patellaria atrata CBS 101060]